MKKYLLQIPVLFLLAGCWGNRFVSADTELESIYMGKSYYEIVEQFGRPDISTQDEEGGSRIVYSGATLNAN